MKNKGLIGTLIVLVVLVVGSMLYDQTKSDSHRNEKVKIGILQYVTHEALDEIERGIEDGLADAGYDKSNADITVLNAEGDQSKIQTMRKEAGFEVMDHIAISYEADEKVSAIFDNNGDSIMGEVLGVSIVAGNLAGYEKEWNINGEKVKLAVEKQ